MKTGIYRHYKGKLYLVLGVASSSEDETEVVVVYVPLYDHSGHAMKTRPYAMFNEIVDPLTGKAPAPGSLGSAVPRFAHVGDTLP